MHGELGVIVLLIVVLGLIAIMAGWVKPVSPDGSDELDSF